jgi:DnaD/phage-associated family protein
MDVVRALRYWQKVNLLSLEETADGQICGIHMLSVDSNASAADVQDKTAPAPVVSMERTIFTPVMTVAPVQSAASAQTTQPVVTATPAASIAPVAPTHSAATISSAQNTAPAYQPPAKRRYTADEIMSFRKDETISELIFVVETYTKRTLSENDMNTILFWYEQLHFSPELIVYLLEYCISKGHTSMRYMDKVALGWHAEGITSVEQAKQDAAIHSQAYYGVMKALGITGRSLVDSEKKFISKWTKDYMFDLPLIQEACSRTITATHQPSFEYTDSILTSWHKNHVHTLADVQKLDSAFSKSKKTASRTAPATRKNSFTNFSSRDYDYDHLEEILLSSSAN